MQVGGIRSGRVQDLELVGDRVLVTFEVDNDVEFGTESRASVEVLNLLGEKYLQLDPAGPDQQPEDEPIPLDRTDSAYDIVGVFGDLTTTTEEIDTDQLVEALDVLAQAGRPSRTPWIQRRRVGAKGLALRERQGSTKGYKRSEHRSNVTLRHRSGCILRRL